jgi:DNA-binding MarR family transcriptional regulator
VTSCLASCSSRWLVLNNITEFSVLELLLHKGPQTIQKIKEKILIASSSTTYVIDQLHKKGYVTRTPSEKDRRITYVELTGVNSSEESCSNASAIRFACIGKISSINVFPASVKLYEK